MSTKNEKTIDDYKNMNAKMRAVTMNNAKRWKAAKIAKALAEAMTEDELNDAIVEFMNINE